MEKEDKRIITMRDEVPHKAVLKMGLPLVAGMFIMVLYNLVDTFYIGMLPGDYQMAAVNLGYPVMMIMIAFGNMVGTGASSLIARSLGAGNTDKAEHTLLAGYQVTLVLSLLIAATGLGLLDSIVRLLGAAAETTAYTKAYVQALFLGDFFLIGNYSFGQLLRAEGSVKYSVIGMVLGTVANVVLDPLFIFGLHMGVRGAAIATVLGNALGVALFLVYYARRKTLLAFHRCYLRPDPAIIGEIFRVGLPASLETLLTSATFVVLNNLAVGYGELTVAAMGISQKLMSLGSYVYQGFAAGLQPLMGFNYGARNYPRMLRLLKANILVIGGIELCVMGIFELGAPLLIGLFTQSTEVIAIGSKVLRINMWILPFVGAISSCRATFQSIGKPLYALGITICRQLVLFIPLLLLFNRLWGFLGLLCAQPVTECVMMLAATWLLRRYIRALY